MTAVHTDDWHVDLLDVDAYLARIDHPRVAPTAESLRSLTRAHVRAIPFENVDVVLGTHRGIGLDAITDKLVHRPRGGYCYEHALLFAAVAQRLGFEVRRLIARVQPHRSGPRTHMTLRVRADGVDHLVDVGFGAAMLVPMPLRDGAQVDQAGWMHRLTRADGLWTLARRTADGWEPLHEFDESRARPIDYQVAHHYVSTHPASPFTGRLVVMRLDEGVSRRLVGDELTVEHADGRVKRTPVPPDHLNTTLRDLGVGLDAAELAELRAQHP
ncbi:arylamine N-acetyltransferase family protein [Pseudonocardia acaciae]|uniref:arylamine N-acetyltransferase family protein n=1 Tax=Pseudonocardia acaciae TaxID=551276 RepID=UPI0004900CD5|nr:arylamine N-acetyltransferase [Pseudonocardia acaciae]